MSQATRVDSVRRLVGWLGLAAVLTVVPATFAHAQTTTPRPSGSPAASPAAPVGGAQEQVVLSGTVTVPKGTVVGEIVVFHGRANILGSVSGDVVVLDGPINVVGGYITGSVVALNGPIRITGPSLIGGDVLGGEMVSVEAGAKIGGQIRQNVGFTLQGPLAALGILVGGAAIAVSVLLLGFLLLLLAPRGADRVATAVSTAPLASFGWGLVIAIGLPLACVALMVAIVGLPLGLAVLLALSLLFLMGLAWSAWALGRLMVRAPRSRWLAFLAGWAIVALLGLVPFLNLAVWGLASVLGLGAALVAIWRARGGARGGRHRVGGLIPEAPVLLPEAAVKAPAASGDGQPPPSGEPEPEPIYPSTSDD
jgi:hypothetical protein